MAINTLDLSGLLRCIGATSMAGGRNVAAWAAGLLGIEKPALFQAPEEAESGYHPVFREGSDLGNPIGTNIEQGHHFAACLMLGEGTGGPLSISGVVE